MAKSVREIMNPELFSAGPDDRAADALEAILDYGITTVPVLDEERRPIGVTSLRDLVSQRLKNENSRHVDCLSSPAITVSSDASVESAARVMATTGLHHLVVVGGDGRAVGIISSLDLLQALVGFPVQHPKSFPHLDAVLGVSWSDPLPFEVEYVSSAAPIVEGILVLSTGGRGRPEHDLLAEPCTNLRKRLTELLDTPQLPQDSVVRALAQPHLRFRYATVNDEKLRRDAARRLQDRIARAPFPEKPLVPDRMGEAD